MFGYELIRYSPEDNPDEFEFLHNKNRLDKSQINSLALKILKRHKFKQPKELLRSYDIDKIRHERVLNSFTIGRKLKHKENNGIPFSILIKICYLLNNVD